MRAVRTVREARGVRGREENSKRENASMESIKRSRIDAGPVKLKLAPVLQQNHFSKKPKILFSKIPIDNQGACW